jgi:hypothetical protein
MRDAGGGRTIAPRTRINRALRLFHFAQELARLALGAKAHWAVLSAPVVALEEKGAIKAKRVFALFDTIVKGFEVGHPIQPAAAADSFNRAVPKTALQTKVLRDETDRLMR